MNEQPSCRVRISNAEMQMRDADARQHLRFRVELGADQGPQSFD